MQPRKKSTEMGFWQLKTQSDSFVEVSSKFSIPMFFPEVLAAYIINWTHLGLGKRTHLGEKPVVIIFILVLSCAGELAVGTNSGHTCFEVLQSTSLQSFSWAISWPFQNSLVCTWSSASTRLCRVSAYPMLGQVFPLTCVRTILMYLFPFLLFHDRTTTAPNGFWLWAQCKATEACSPQSSKPQSRREVSGRVWRCHSHCLIRGWAWVCILLWHILLFTWSASKYMHQY